MSVTQLDYRARLEMVACRVELPRTRTLLPLFNPLLEGFGEAVVCLAVVRVSRLAGVTLGREEM